MSPITSTWSIAPMKPSISESEWQTQHPTINVSRHARFKRTPQLCDHTSSMLLHLISKRLHFGEVRGNTQRRLYKGNEGNKRLCHWQISDLLLPLAYSLLKQQLIPSKMPPLVFISLLLSYIKATDVTSMGIHPYNNRQISGSKKHNTSLNLYSP